MFTFLQAAPVVPGLLLPLMMMIVLIVVIIPYVFYLVTLQNTFKAIAPENRTMEPGLVWLMFIPLFNMVWNFFIVSRLADSIQAELAKKGESVAERPAYGVGLAMCILGCVTWIPILGSIAAIVALVCWIIHWVKITEFKRKIESFVHVEDNDSLIFGTKDY